ncbi:uncharacterized protein LOC119692529 [Plutella xylostella]|uniref:uncharacterized protein LOC119692529 n=1 Tax=Plutella xylostella TaxID=51655 RepID=UPI002032799B|nr:uncharacterized protein LOC119692529 [Plutella xylostella]
MIHKEQEELRTTPISQHDKKKCGMIAVAAIVQSVAVFALGATVLGCMWSVERALFEFDTLARVMYLYDPEACGHGSTNPRTFHELVLSNDTRGFTVVPIKRLPPVATKSTRLAAEMRRHVTGSIVLHGIWFLLSVYIRCLCGFKNVNVSVLRYSLIVFFWSFVLICIFDTSMGIVYIAHVQQSLTIGMIVRYSGWLRLKISNYEDFGGWLPLALGGCWLKGAALAALNFYCCGVIRAIMRNVSARDYRRRLVFDVNEPIPEPLNATFEKGALYYRLGEEKPFKINSSD